MTLAAGLIKPRPHNASPTTRRAPTFAGQPAAWGHSSAGRALQWHCRGQRFDPAWLHQYLLKADFRRDIGLFVVYWPIAMCSVAHLVDPSDSHMDYLDFALLWELRGQLLSTIGLAADVTGFIIIASSAFRVQALERKARQSDTKSGAFAHLGEQLSAGAYRERHALASKGNEAADDLKALETRLKSQSDWFRGKRDEYVSEATQVRALGFKMEETALRCGAALIVGGTALQGVAVWVA